MTQTIRSIIREALDRVNSHTAASLDTIATDAEAAIRALLGSDAAVEAAWRAYCAKSTALYEERRRAAIMAPETVTLDLSGLDRPEEMRAALTAATRATP